MKFGYGDIVCYRTEALTPDERVRWTHDDAVLMVVGECHHRVHLRTSGMIDLMDLTGAWAAESRRDVDCKDSFYWQLCTHLTGEPL